MDSSKKFEKKNPLDGANPISKLFLFWMRELFWTGMKKELQEEDLYNPIHDDKSEVLGDKLEKNWLQEQERALAKGKEPSLVRAIVKTFWGWYLIFASLLAFQTLVIKIMQPLLLSWLLKYFATDSKTSLQEAYGYAGGILLCSFMAFILIHHYGLGVNFIGMRMRIACCSLLYRKVLRLNIASMGATATGQVVNLMSNDVARFDTMPWFFTYLWLMPIQLPIVTYFLWTYVGVSSFIGLGFILLQTLPLQAVMGKLSAKLRMMIALRTDERVRLMSEIISGIQVIKMYAWEKPFAHLVELARRKEINVVTKASYLRGLYLSFMMFNERSALFATLLAYVLFGNEITAEKVFAASSFFSVLNQMFAMYFPTSISITAETLVSIRRMRTFLTQDEISKPAIQEKVEGEVGGVMIVGGTAKWSSEVLQDTLSKIDMRVKPGQLCAIIGQVGSGKSSLFNAILGELPLQDGSLRVGGKMSYASQEPWLFTGSVRNNILFGQTYESKKYREVVRVCALVRDFELFPYGDKTLVGDRGVSLSGGQKARINLARCVYKEADVYLLDDPLSAVDAHVGKHLFKECITGYLREKAVLLATHQLHLLKHLDHIVILENGGILTQGSYDEMVKTGLDFAQLLGTEGEEEPDRFKKVSQPTRQKKMSQMSQLSVHINPAASQRRRGLSIMSIASSLHDADQFEAPEEVAETRTQGEVTWASYKDYFRAGGNICFIFVVLFMVLLTQVNVSGVDYFVSFWTKEEEQYNVNKLPDGSSTYDRSVPQKTALIIYGCIVASLTILSISRSLIFFKMCMRASIGLHNKMFINIIRATMNFFDTNPAGRILNRFSKDMGSVDELLPKAMIEASQVMLMMVGVLVLVLVASYFLVVPMAIVGIVFFLIRIVYLNTARNVKRLEGITRSPVFNHLSASLNGLTTIRASQAQDLVKQEFDTHQNLHTSAWFLYVATATAFGFYLDFFSALFTGVVTFSFLVLGQDTFGSNVGLAISQSISLTGLLQYGIRQSAEVVNQMTSVERVLEYTHIEKESQIETSPPKHWPTHGEVKFNKMFLKYTPTDPPVLKDLNFVIKPKQKVGIVGRTGAGKSSLIAALFRLARQEGEILIDGVDTTHIGLGFLRSAISIIPQEPVLFSASIRDNLDPFNQFEDFQLWNALEEVELKVAVDSLEFHVNEGGSNFSVGQRQLVCLARAILRNNRILVLDEATANVDPQTDALIQATIRRRFAECTVLTIAHRLNTIMDSDMVLVMDAGTMVEFDTPHTLLQKGKGGFLWGMVQETGPAMALHLADVAREAFTKVVTPAEEPVTEL